MQITTSTTTIKHDYYGQLFKIEVSLKSDPSNKWFAVYSVYGKLRKSATKPFIEKYISEITAGEHAVYNYRLITL